MEKGKKRENAEKTAWTKKQRKIDAKVTKSSRVMRKKECDDCSKKGEIEEKRGGIKCVFATYTKELPCKLTRAYGVSSNPP